ncbi:MarR family transcriptional regulator [Candidatus Saccharibacteria bacterium]|jgi:DNA-binding MarR family transcriptional regulator|nr:MarR family transcriptional regulator [Candidatus Saccharibacteria bacterium]MBP9132169.1 MarR family transcriptional regulator [Candidatus Saccharibacteria bacterium]
MSKRDGILEAVIEDFHLMHRSILRSQSNTKKPLPIGQKVTLQVVALRRRLSVKELASILKITPGAATQQVEALVKRGLLRRTTDKADRRVSLITLSSSGDTYYNKMVSQRALMVKSIFQNISDDELVLYKNVTSKICQQLENNRDEE